MSVILSFLQEYNAVIRNVEMISTEVNVRLIILSFRIIFSNKIKLKSKLSKAAGFTTGGTSTAKGLWGCENLKSFCEI